MSVLFSVKGSQASTESGPETTPTAITPISGSTDSNFLVITCWNFVESQQPMHIFSVIAGETWLKKHAHFMQSCAVRVLCETRNCSAVVVRLAPVLENHCKLVPEIVQKEM